VLKKVRPYFSLDTKLGNVPRDWLFFVEPKIIRPQESTCWLWQGGMDGYGEPILAYTDPVTKKRTAVRLKVVVMKLFWDGLKGHEIVHECGNLNCVNPHHLFVSTTSWRVKDRKRLISKKRTNIRGYIKYEKNRDEGL
jgi:hypothetical protein